MNERNAKAAVEGATMKSRQERTLNLARAIDAIRKDADLYAAEALAESAAMPQTAASFDAAMALAAEISDLYDAAAYMRSAAIALRMSAGGEAE